MVVPIDAYAVRRSLTGLVLNGEVAAVSPWVRAGLEFMETLQVEHRSIAWEARLAGREDRDEWTNALKEVDPSAPPPEVEEVGPRRYKLTRADEVTTRQVEWVWPFRVPRGMLSLFAGDPKLGKSLVTIGVAAAVSRGAPPPGAAEWDTEPGSVVLLSAEDDPSRTIVPRLKAAGARLDRIRLLEAVYLSDGAEALPNLVADIDAIEAAIAEVGDCRLVIVDPVSAYIGGTDDHKNSQLRGLLSPLKAMAERRNVAVILVTHLTKSASTNAKHRVTGSIAYVGACRANFLFVKDIADSTGRRVFMVSAGCNLVEDPPTLAYRVEDHGDGPVVCWEAEPVPITAEAALQAEAEPVEDRDDRDECDTWLREMLENASVYQPEIEREGKAVGFNPSAINRAKKRIGARTKRSRFGKGSRCYWTLPPA